MPVTDAQNVRHEPSHQSHRQAARGGLQPFGPLGQRHEIFANGQQQLHERHRDQAARDSQHRVGDEFDRADQLVGRNMKQRLIAQQQVQRDPGRGGAEHDGAEHRRVQIAHHFFEREQHGRHRRVESRRQRRRRAHRNQLANPVRAQAQTPAEHRRDSRAHLHRRPFASQRDAAGERCRAAPELPEHRAKADEAVAQEQRRFGLRDAAAACVGEKAREQIAGDERAAGRNQNAPPGRASGRIHAGAQILGDVDECRDHQPDQRADDQRQQQQDFVFVLEEGLAVGPMP